MSSSTKVWIFIIVSSLSFLIAGYSIGDRLGLFFSFLITLGFQYFVFLGLKPILLIFYPSTKVQGTDALRLNQFLENLAQENNFQLTPRIFMFHSKTINSFALKLPWKSGLIALSDKTLEKCTLTEIHSLLAYHTYYLNRSNSFFTELSLTLVSTMQSFIFFLDQFINKLFKTSKISVFSFLLQPLTDALIKLNYSKQFYFDCDKFVIQKFKNEKEYSNLIWKIYGWNKSLPIYSPISTNGFFFVEADHKAASVINFNLQPKIEQRLKKIIGYYPI